MQPRAEASATGQDNTAIIAAAITPPLPGQKWPEHGGTYVGIMRGDDMLYHLILSDEPDSDIGDLEWGQYGKDIPGCDSKWNGFANTLALIDAGFDKFPILSALKSDDLHTYPGWYIPAQRELALCHAVVPDLFERDWYWSSTQYSSGSAWYQGFENGGQDIDDKDTKGRARAVRRLIIQ